MGRGNGTPAAAIVEEEAAAGAKGGDICAEHDSTPRRGGEPVRHTCRSRNPWDNVPPEVMAVARNARAARWWSEAERRLKDCPEAKALIWGMARAEVEARRRFSFARIVKDVADKRIVTASGEDFRVNNNHISAYARMFLRDCPQASKFMNRPRESMFDFLAAAGEREGGENAQE